MTKHLESTQRNATSARTNRHPNGWTPERRARQSALIRGWQPWRRSTGPKTDAGKTRCAMNALKHGYRSREHIELRRQAVRILRRSARNIATIRAYIRERAAPPPIRIKPTYAKLLATLTRSESGPPSRRSLAALVLEHYRPKGLGRP